MIHIKGIHRALQPPYFWFKKNRSLKFEATFTEKSKYIIDGPDQKDWNKLFGISAHLNPHKDSAMIAWRYNDKEDVFEVAPYWHTTDELDKEFWTRVGTQGGRVSNFFTATARVNQAIKCGIKQSSDVYAWEINGKVVAELRRTSQPKTRRLASWFGGNKKPPCNLSVKMKKI